MTARTAFVPSLPLRLAMVLLGAFGSPAAAQVVLLPIDSRPTTRELPAYIAGLSGEEVHVPPAELLGDARRGADPQALREWLDARPPGPLIVALDALAYGGLVQSRRSELSAEEALARLESVRGWRERTGQPVYAFITLPREPDATNRERNFAVAQRVIEWAREGLIDELHVTWDDAKKGSPAPEEGARLRQGAPENVKVYPGADEVLSALAARALSPTLGRVAVEYSDPGRATQITQYEGVPLEESVRQHAGASGWDLTPTLPAPILTPFGGTGTRPQGPHDLYLYVYNGGNPRAAALRVAQLLRAGPVAVVDIRAVNQGTYPLWLDLSTLDRVRELDSLAAWGTVGNNLGAALAHAKIARGGEGAEFAVRQDALLAREYANDVIFSVKLRPALRKAVPEAELANPGVPEVLARLASEYFPIRLNGEYRLAGASLPWNRSFEWRFDLELTDEPSAD